MHFFLHFLQFIAFYFLSLSINVFSVQYFSFFSADCQGMWMCYVFDLLIGEFSWFSSFLFFSLKGKWLEINIKFAKKSTFCSIEGQREQIEVAISVKKDPILECSFKNFCRIKKRKCCQIYSWACLSISSLDRPVFGNI